MAEIHIPMGPIETEPIGAIRARVHELTQANRDALAAAMEGIELGTWDRRIAEWLAGWEPSTVATIVSWLRRVRAAAVEGRIVLDEPAELGLSWDDGGDFLTLAGDGITLYPGGVDEMEMTATEARELAAQLAAMANAVDQSQGGGV